MLIIVVLCICNYQLELFVSFFQSIDQLLSQDWSQGDKINIKPKIIYLKQEKCTKVLFLWEYYFWKSCL